MPSIIRIDKPKNSKKGTHGWQVRVPTGVKKKYHSKMFSDKLHGSSDKALAAAKEYLDAYLKQHPEAAERPPNRPPFFHTLTRRNTSGVNGVFRSHHYYTWDKDRVPRYYWAASCPTGPNGRYFAKRFYIESHGELTARQMAIEFRKMWEEAMEQGEEAVAEFFEREHFDTIPL